MFWRGALLLGLFTVFARVGSMRDNLDLINDFRSQYSLESLAVVGSDLRSRIQARLNATSALYLEHTTCKRLEESLGSLVRARTLDMVGFVAATDCDSDIDLILVITTYSGNIYSV